MDWLTGLLAGGAFLIGNNLTRKANDRAAQTVAASTDRATQVQVQANQAAQQQLQEAQKKVEAAGQQTQQKLDVLAGQGQPGIDYLRTLTVTNPYSLNPQQQLQLEDARRVAVNSMPSGLRGSGRAVTASVRRVEEGTRGDMIASNQRRSDSAANVLAGMGNNAAMQSAQVPVQTAGQSANIIGQGANITSQTGRTIADNTMTGATTLANADVASANSSASTLGAIASIFANDSKERARDERYKKLSGVSA